MIKKYFKTIIQISTILILFLLAYLHQKYGIEKAAPIDAFCPMGAIEGLLTFIFSGEFLKKIYTSTFIVFIIFFLSSFFLGRVFCGYFCPIGAIQEWINNLAKKLKIKNNLELPKNIDKYLRYLKYIILLLIIIASYYLNKLAFSDYDPFKAMMHFGAEIDEILIGYIVLFLIIIFAFFSKSLWCRYLCPFGAFLAIIKKISFIKIYRDNYTCIHCKICDKICPSNLDISNTDVLNNSDCINCNKCITNCPKNSLYYKIFNKQISIKNFNLLIILLIIIPFLIIINTPIWQTKAPSNIIDSTGNINIQNIKGSNTLQYIIDTTKIPLEVFIEKLNLPKDIDTKLKLKEIGPIYNIYNQSGTLIKTEDFRNVINDYLKNERK